MREGFAATHRLGRPVRDRIELEPLAPITDVHPGDATPLKVKVARDGMPNASVTYAVSGIGLLSTTSGTTNADGQAPTFDYSVPADSPGGTATITATFQDSSDQLTISVASVALQVVLSGGRGTVAGRAFFSNLQPSINFSVSRFFDASGISESRNIVATEGMRRGFSEASYSASGSATSAGASARGLVQGTAPVVSDPLSASGSASPIVEAGFEVVGGPVQYTITGSARAGNPGIEGGNLNHAQAILTGPGGSIVFFRQSTLPRAGRLPQWERDAPAGPLQPHCPRQHRLLRARAQRPAELCQRRQR